MSIISYIINDATSTAITHLKEFGRGLDLSRRGPKPYEYGTVATPFDDSLLIHRSEWRARIEEMRERKSFLSDFIRAAKLPPKNQEQTNFCWCNAPVHSLEIVRAQQGQRQIILSPASVACRINGFRNEGGWGKEALQFITENGVSPASTWPANAINRSFDTPANESIARHFRVEEWTELEPRNLDQLVSMLLRRIPVAVGYNWWSHEVTAVDADWIDGEVAIRIRNSWGNWGDGNGFGILQGNRRLPDDAVAPRTATAMNGGAT